jgi:hypothetical protein
MSAFDVRSRVSTTNISARLHQQQRAYQNMMTIMSLSSSDENSDTQESSKQVATKPTDGNVYDDEVRVSQIMVPRDGKVPLDNKFHTCYFIPIVS